MKGSFGRYFLPFLLALFYLPFASAQTSFAFSNETVEPGEYFNVNLTVNSFTNIVGAQFTVRWDSSMLRFVGLSNLALDLTTESNFGTNKVSSGKLTFVWADNDLSGENLSDNSTLFSIFFEAIGTPDTTTVYFSNEMPTVIEITDTNGNTVDADFISGLVEIEMPVGASYVSAPDKAEIVSCYPNPFNQNTHIQLSLHQPTLATVSIIDAGGKTIYQEQRSLGSGLQALQFDQTRFPQAGTYYVRVQTPEFLAMQRLVFVR